MTEKIDFDPAHAARTRAALDAREAARAGIDARPGRRVTLRVSSRGMHAVAGRLVHAGENVLENVHESDVGAFLRDVETATPEELARVEAEQRARIADRDAARRKGEGYRKHLTWEAVFTEVLRRGPRPFTSVEILDASEPEPTATKRGARA